MNIAFFLLPKLEVVCITIQYTLRQTLEKMEHHRYTAIPVLDDTGKYIGTITEGDLLWFFKNQEGMSLENAHRRSISEVPMRLDNRAVRIDANMDDLIRLAKVQNFVPVVDDSDNFIGIVRRSDIIDYCASKIFVLEHSSEVG
ncbi:CBS domain-containing protein [Paenibacillus sp. KN14-4R]|uniref:CBS domain-containing protein n=1 Tax=Paenibacillus sp. KN14-4R TaxID=3445773 RepID=UPI003FA0B4A3